ncbi:MAG: KUP/HAK/KT family potassium transporter [Bacteroidia bacterium]|nr:KUP/HAK/KT family potassium transporter [Bacteroidia bacterium]MDW8157629.1 KUP/HAK/KT family potassium transporter [Bacteroidia bacterium]
MSHNRSNKEKATAAGLLVALGIIYGDIGTSPLYVMKAIVGDRPISEILLLGGLSCIFWTLTFQTTLKYVIFTLRADNKGEGGIFSLYALVRSRANWLIYPAIIGGSTLLADGVITPSISISSAIEGLLVLNPKMQTVPIVIGILLFLFFFVQPFGTNKIGKFFGPIMLVWFLMLGTLGTINLIAYPYVLKAINPYYAVELLTSYPQGFWLLGAVFLCTTGAEALYSDLGHCGRANIRISWIFVKTMLLLNYFGQGAWLYQLLGKELENQNPFYAIMPSWFVIVGIIIATLATIIASQALITGSFTLISEAITLNLWPRLRIVYPSLLKGQLFIPAINFLLCIGCCLVVVYFQSSEHMEAAYGLAITLTMLMTTILLFNYLQQTQMPPTFVFSLTAIFGSLEICFFIANIVKFQEGGWITLLISGLLAFVMFVWHNAGIIKKRYNFFVSLTDQLGALKELSADTTIPKYATHLVYLTASTSPHFIEDRIIYSIFRKQPKRADIYWFIHITTLDEPHTAEYIAHIIVPDDVIWVEFRLGFRVQPRINLYFRKVVEDLVQSKEVNIISRYQSLAQRNVAGDFRFVVMERYLSYGIDFPDFDKFIMDVYFFLKRFAISEERGFGLDTSSVTVEKIPLTTPQIDNIKLQRVFID